jgi:hypothetical protein
LENKLVMKIVTDNLIEKWGTTDFYYYIMYLNVFFNNVFDLLIYY